MSHTKLTELPKNIQESLPMPAQKIFLVAYNNAIDLYEATNVGDIDDSQIDVATQVAWFAVKKHYKKNEKTNSWAPRYKASVN